MEDFINVFSPVIYWTIRDYQACEKVLSPTFNFFGFKWRLKFTRFMDVDDLKAQILLESLSESNRVKTLPIYCESDANGNSEFIQVKTVVLENEICCVWSSTISHLSKYYPYPYHKNIAFSIKLAPSRSSGNLQVLTEEHKRQEILENIPWMTSLLKDFESLYNNKDHSDYELKCGELSLAVHKSILSVRCSYFAALFSSPMKESERKYVEFQNIEPESLEHVIRYFYTGTLPKMSFDTTHKVFSVADMFLCEPLKAKCVPLMMDNFINENQTVPENPKEEKPLEKSEDCKELLKQLFLTREWKKLSYLYPNLVHEMCRPIHPGTVKV